MRALKKSPYLRAITAIVAVVLAMGLAPLGAWAAPADQTLKAGSGDLTAQAGEKAADPIDVYMTVSNKGTLALAHQKVTVSDTNKDGKITYDEALQAAHEKYCKDGYASNDTGVVTKLWGVTTTFAMLYQNDVSIPVYANAQEVKAGDDLVAAVIKDQEGYSDCFGYFDKKAIATTAGETFTLTLKADSWGTTLKVPSIQVGTWKDGTFTVLADKATDADGKITLSFDKPGAYVVSANGTVENGGKNCPLTAPYCIVTVQADPIDVYMTVSNAGTLALARQKVTVTDLNKDSVISFDEALQATHEKYCKGGYSVTQFPTYAWVTSLWGVKDGGYIFYKNDTMTTNVCEEAVAQGDDLVAAVQKDTKYYSDHYSYFDKKELTVKAGTEFALKLAASQPMDPTALGMAAKSVQVGTWKGGKFTALKGKTTDKDGKVTLSFDKIGTYVVSASGTVSDDVTVDWATGKTEKMDCLITAPVCIVTVTQGDNTMKVSAIAQKNIPAATYGKNSTIAAKKAISVKDARGAVTYKKVSGNAKITVASNGKITVKKGLKVGTYKVKIAVTAAGNASFKKATKNVTVALSVKKANTMKVSVATKSVKLADVKSKAKAVAPITVKNAKGTKAFEVTKWTTAKAKKYIKVNAKSGKVTVAKGTPKGTYKFNVKITAKGNKTFKELSVTKAITVKVVK